MNIPTNISECFDELDKMFSEIPKDLKVFKESDEEKALATFHNSLGRWIRNNWGLWTRDSKIYNTFNDMQLWHADDMSSVIIVSYHRYINDVDIDLKGQIESYLKYWEEYEKTNGPIIKK